MCIFTDLTSYEFNLLRYFLFLVFYVENLELRDLPFFVQQLKKFSFDLNLMTSKFSKNYFYVNFITICENKANHI